MDGFFDVNFPFLLMAMSLYLLFELVRLNQILKMWEIENLMIIPFLILSLCFYVGMFTPTFETSRLLLRLVIATSLGISIHVTHAYYLKAVIQRGKP